MVKQTPISVRLDNEVKWQLDQEAMLGYETRNRMINEGAQMYIAIKDARRSIRATADMAVRRKIAKGILRLFLPEVVDLIPG